ncbi:MAG TPA: enolase C-terminal domain-like protein [Edaphobacter sp.]|uniref:enolase C-terminal domain-like protein n=1 Tax=Edaphobacter sp. TaxID=1934404 RepID=UPI002D0A3C13|nr:enolase C-terminal domain-like protein [Edaphobacter sp.]HUZ94526.1 enolase C-terminal domain-like protein [Edaphobacter sp.]
MFSQANISASKVRVFTIPTDAPEADGTYAWNSSTMVLVTLESGHHQGLGYTYADVATGKLVETLLEMVVTGCDVFSHGAILQSMYRHVRNLGETGITMMAIAAIDNALWDLRARLLNIPLVSLLGMVRESIPVYGSGGFTSYNDEQLETQLAGWVKQGCSMVKMKVGTHPSDDPRRVSVARKAIGDDTELFVDANGAYSVTQALELALLFSEQNVRWFEEPVSSDNLTGLNQIRSRAPHGMDIAAGEYGYTAWYFKQMIDAQAITVLQADATRCGGISGFLDVAALCWAANIPLSSHCGPSMHLHVCCAVPRAIHMEFFHDHARIERMFFDGFCEPVSGVMKPNLSRPGAGLELKTKAAEPYAI